MGDQWRETHRRRRGLELGRDSEVVYRGRSALAFRNIRFFFRVLYEPVDQIDALGYTSLHFAIHLGDARPRGFSDDPELNVVINEISVPLLLRCTPSDVAGCRQAVIACDGSVGRSVPSAPYVWNIGMG